MKNISFRKILPPVIVMAFGILAALPLFLPGFLPTHDGEYHLIRFHEFANMIVNGYWFPRWAPDLNSGYGVPLFNFNYPLPNYFGAFFHFLGLTLADSFKLTLAVGYLSAITFCFLWLSKLFSKTAAAAATVVFAYVPYWFVDIYIRGSVGEVLAISFLMVALAAIERDRKPVLALAIGMMVLSHNILALIFLPIIFIYILLVKPRLWWTILIGLGLSAYFWIPALAEQKYVVGLNTVNYRDYFGSLAQLLIPSWGTGYFGSGVFGNEMSIQIGIIPLFLLAAGIIQVLRKKVQRNTLKLPFFLVIALISVFFVLKLSLFFWQTIPLLSFTQYPWRFLSVILPVSAFLAAYIFAKLKKVWFMYSVTLLAVILAYSYSRPVVYQPRSDEYYLSRPNFTDGTNSLGNSFSTIWSPWKQERPKSRIEFLSGGGQITNIFTKPLEYKFNIDSPEPSSIRLNVLYYPGWKVFLDGNNLPIIYQNEGTINFTAPAGKHAVKVLFTETQTRLFADFISILSLLCLFFWPSLKKIRSNHRLFF